MEYFYFKDCQTNLKADIVFALDSSGSVGLSNFRKQIDFVKDFVNRFSISSTRTQFSVVTFSNRVNNEFWLNEYQNKHDLIHAIDNIAYRKGSTNTHLALEFVRQNSFLSANGGRSSIEKIVIILTDGQSKIPDVTKKEAELLHFLGAQVISVGISSGADILQLTIIASDTQNVVKVDNIDALTTVETQIQNAACQQTSIKILFKHAKSFMGIQFVYHEVSTYDRNVEGRCTGNYRISFTCYKPQQQRIIHYRACGWFWRNRCQRHMTYIIKFMKSTCYKLQSCPNECGTEVKRLACQISQLRKTGRITLASGHQSQVQDNAFAINKIEDSCKGGKAKRSS
ncbi:COL6A [Mytilus coruscus]|uniref:COL6A n=1 Tax=Mytilus coruscus TaxID=42192 RepID=A0A6J8D0S2_MYTCO|nr:COL6A [Mytilus coruscus]